MRVCIKSINYIIDLQLITLVIACVCVCVCVCASCVIWAIDEPRGQSSAAAAARGGDIARNNRDRRNSRNSRNNRNKPGGTGGERGPGAILRAKAQYGAIWRNMAQYGAKICNKVQ